VDRRKCGLSHKHKIPQKRPLQLKNLSLEPHIFHNLVLKAYTNSQVSSFNLLICLTIIGSE